MDGKIYVIGGLTGGNAFSTVHEYDPAADTWEQKADMPTGRLDFAASVLNKKIYTIGGSGESDVTMADVEIYDPATDTWDTVGEIKNQPCSPGFYLGF